jgi:hypothetical protein
MLYLEKETNRFELWDGELINGIRYPLTIETAWSDEELADIGLYEPAEADPVPDGKVIVSTSVQRVEGVVKFVNVTDDVPLEDLRAAKIEAVEAKMDAIFAAGAPVTVGVDTLHVALTDGSRADLTAMATTAVAASTGAVPWPESYQTGWIAMENVRIALATPADGLGLAAGVGDYYAQVRQNGRDLKDAALAAEDQAALDAVDVESGWPG